MSLEAKNCLIEMEKDDCFFRGLKPKTFQKHIKDELKAQKLWTDLTRLPAMDHIVATAKVLLKHDLYYDESDEDSDDESDHSWKSKYESDIKSDKSDDDMLLDKSDDEEQNPSHKHKTKSTKKTLIKRETKSTSKDVESKSPKVQSEPSKPDPDPMFKLNIDNLANRISKLTIEHLTKQQVRPTFNPQPTMSTAWYCYMCDRDRHELR